MLMTTNCHENRGSFSECAPSSGAATQPVEQDPPLSRLSPRTDTAAAGDGPHSAAHPPADCRQLLRSAHRPRAQQPGTYGNAEPDVKSHDTLFFVLSAALRQDFGINRPGALRKCEKSEKSEKCDGISHISHPEILQKCPISHISQQISKSTQPALGSTGSTRVSGVSPNRF